MTPELEARSKLIVEHGPNLQKAIAVYDFGSMLSMVIDRQNDIQVELFMVHKSTPEMRGFHRHPDVDTVDTVLYGEIPFYGCGNPKLKAGDSIAIDRMDWHMTGEMPVGATFLSVQQWFGREPNTSLALNWEGKPFSSQHFYLLRKDPSLWVKKTSILKH